MLICRCLEVLHNRNALLLNIITICQLPPMLKRSGLTAVLLCVLRIDHGPVYVGC
jgi:hypothetical protein